MRIGSVGARNAHAGDGCFDIGVDLADLNPCILKCGVHLASCFNGEEYHYGQRGEHYQRKIYVYAGKHDKRAYKRYAGYEQILRTVMGKLGYLKKVVYYAAHYRACLVLIKK